MLSGTRPALLACRLILITFCACAVVGCSGDEGKPQDMAEEPADAAKAPDFSLPDLQGEKVDFSDFEGKVVLVDFWATWCGPCKLEIPHLVDLYEQYKDRDFVVLGIALDRPGAEIVEPFVRENNVTYPVVIGNPEIAFAFGGLTAIPTAFLVDRSGRIVKKYVGYTEKAVFEEEIKKLL